MNTHVKLTVPNSPQIYNELGEKQKREKKARMLESLEA